MHKEVVRPLFLALNNPLENRYNKLMRTEWLFRIPNAWLFFKDPLHKVRHHPTRPAVRNYLGGALHFLDNLHHHVSGPDYHSEEMVAWCLQNRELLMIN